MHVQQPQHHQHGQTVTEDIGTENQILQDIPEGLVRRATVETTGLATDNLTAEVVPKHTRGQHQVYAGPFRGGQRVTHIQGLRDPEDAKESRILARKC